MGFDGGCIGGDGDVVAFSFLDFFEEGLVATCELFMEVVEDGQGHGRVDGGQCDGFAFGEVIGAVPVSVLIEVEEGFDGEIETGDQAAVLFGMFDAAAGRDDGGEQLPLFGTALEPTAGAEQFSARGLEIIVSAGFVVIGEARPTAGLDGYGGEER